MKDQKEDDDDLIVRLFCASLDWYGQLERVRWAFGMKQNLDLSDMQFFDKFKSICLELYYLNYQRDRSSTEFRFVHISPSNIVDLDCMKIIDNKFKNTGIIVQRTEEEEANLEKVPNTI